MLSLWACIFHEVVRGEGQCPDSPPELLTHAVTQTHNVQQILIYKTPITLLSVHLLLPSSCPATNLSTCLFFMHHIMGFILWGRKGRMWTQNLVCLCWLFTQKNCSRKQKQQMQLTEAHCTHVVSPCQCRFQDGFIQLKVPLSAAI